MIWSEFTKTFLESFYARVRANEVMFDLCKLLWFTPELVVTAAMSERISQLLIADLFPEWPVFPLNPPPLLIRIQLRAVSYRLLALIAFPNLNSDQGTGSKATAMNPNKLVAHPTPRFWYICTVNKGKAPASPYLARLFALMALATVLPWKVSTRYCVVDTNRQIFPHAKGMIATAGLAHETSGLAVQPNQKMPTGASMLPTMAGKRRYSGGTWCGGCRATCGL